MRLDENIAEAVGTAITWTIGKPDMVVLRMNQRTLRITPRTDVSTSLAIDCRKRHEAARSQKV
ncbi:MAG TPA: hypothetical protein VN647_04555 [Nitrospira sp.]|nr:hypothetical protein [Nitrospira sp.]